MQFIEDIDDSPIQFEKQIRLYLNGDSTKYIDYRLAQNTIWSDFQNALDRKFSKFTTLKLFTQQGVEIFPDDITYLKDGYNLYASRGEEFDPYSPFSQYEVIKPLGEGGFGQVMLAQHRDSQEKVAIKIIKPIGNAQEMDMVFREAEVLRSLNHKHIVKVYNSYILKNTQIAIVMELLEGGELAQRLKTEGKFTEDVACKYFKQILSAISYCHQKKFIHRDLKLENLLFVSKEYEELKTIDFGIAGFQCQANTDNVNIGTLYYMAPEVLGSRIHRVTPSVDIWAMGIILYQMLFGIFPFDGKTKNDVASSIVHDALRFPHNNLSEEALNLLQACLDKNHEQRMHAVDMECHPWINSEQRTPQQTKLKLLTPRADPKKTQFSRSPRHSSPNLQQYQRKLQVPISKFSK